MTSATVGDRRSVAGGEHEWIVPLVLGTATVVLGIVLIANPFASARTLAILVALGIILHGVLEMLQSRQSSHPGFAFVVGALLVLGGIVALSWPGITLWVLAVLVGLSILVAGAGRAIVAVADRRGFSGWPLLLISGVLSILFGVVAIAWPKATVVVLAVLFGLQITLVGLVQIAAAVRLRQQARTGP